MWIWHWEVINLDAKLQRQDMKMRTWSQIYAIELYLTTHL